MSKLHGTVHHSQDQKIIYMYRPGWFGHAGKEMRRRRKANRVAKQARKRNRD